LGCFGCLLERKLISFKKKVFFFVQYEPKKTRFKTMFHQLQSHASRQKSKPLPNSLFEHPTDPVVSISVTLVAKFKSSSVSDNCVNSVENATSQEKRHLSQTEAKKNWTTKH